MTTATKVSKSPALISGAAAIDKAILSISNRGKKLDGDIQVCGLSVLAHIEQHGDISLFIKLYMAMSAGSRRNALVDWACQFGKLDVNLREDKKERPFLYAKGKTTNLVGAMEKPWYKCKPEKALADEFDFIGKIQGLLDAASKAAAAGTPIKGLEQYERFKAFCALPAPTMALPDEVQA